jgi:hypothetical protein
MENIKQQAFSTFDLLDERGKLLIIELMGRLVPDDVATSRDVELHAAAMSEYRNGETVNHNAIDWN